MNWFNRYIISFTIFDIKNRIKTVDSSSSLQVETRRLICKKEPGEWTQYPLPIEASMNTEEPARATTSKEQEILSIFLDMFKLLINRREWIKYFSKIRREVGKCIKRKY